MVNIGVIGVGRIGKVHIQSIVNSIREAKVLAAADPQMTEETAAWVRGMGIPDVYTDYKKILGDPRIQAVLVCSSTNTHSVISIEALDAGKHVFCEKPVDLDLAKIQKVIDAMNRHPELKLQVGFNRRFDHNFEAVRDAVKAGKIGDVHIVKITSRDPAPPPAQYVKVSGGIFLDMTIHDFDMVRYLSGSEVEEVYVAAGVLVDPEIGAAGDVDTAVITLKLKNGAIAVIDNSRKAVYGYDQRAEVFGSKGMVAAANDAPTTAVVSTEEGVAADKPLWFFLERYMQSFTKEVTMFVDAVANNKPVPVGIDDGLQPVRIGLAAGKSLREGRPVKLSEI